jgi:hypothetical protein
MVNSRLQQWNRCHRKTLVVKEYQITHTLNLRRPTADTSIMLRLYSPNRPGQSSDVRVISGLITTLKTAAFVVLAAKITKVDF